jgi:hypothetical protein
VIKPTEERMMLGFLKEMRGRLRGMFLKWDSNHQDWFPDSATQETINRARKEWEELELDQEGHWDRFVKFHGKYKIARVGEYMDKHGSIVSMLDYVPKVP